MQTIETPFKNAFISSIPVMAGYLFLGTAFGLVMNAHDFNLLFVLAMSIFVYAGSLQFVGVDLLVGGAVSFVAVALTSFMVNARHVFYGISMLDRYKNAGKKKLYMIFALTDETYSLVCNGYRGDAKQEHSYYFFISLFNQCYWVIGSVLGCLIGELLPFKIVGIDFALTALFVTVFCDQWINSISHFSAVTGVFSSVLCLLIFGADRFLIPSMLLILTVLSVKKLLEGKKHEHD